MVNLRLNTVNIVNPLQNCGRAICYMLYIVYARPNDTARWVHNLSICVTGRVWDNPVSRTWNIWWGWCDESEYICAQCDPWRRAFTSCNAYCAKQIKCTGLVYLQIVCARLLKSMQIYYGKAKHSPKGGVSSIIGRVNKPFGRTFVQNGCQAVVISRMGTLLRTDKECIYKLKEQQFYLNMIVRKTRSTICCSIAFIGSLRTQTGCALYHMTQKVVLS